MHKRHSLSDSHSCHARWLLIPLPQSLHHYSLPVFPRMRTFAPSHRQKTYKGNRKGVQASASCPGPRSCLFRSASTIECAPCTEIMERRLNTWSTKAKRTIWMRQQTHLSFVYQRFVAATHHSACADPQPQFDLVSGEYSRSIPFWIWS